MEESGYDFVHDAPGVAGTTYGAQGLVVVAEGVHVEEPRSGEEESEHVRQSHRHEDCVGRRPHVPLGQDHHDEGVGDDGDEEEKRHDVAVHGLGELDRNFIRYVQVVH